MRRLQAIDPLLSRPAADQPSCGVRLAAADRAGQPVDTATCEHWTAASGSLDRTWGAERRFHLTAKITGPTVDLALDQLLSQWHDHLADVPGTSDEDTAAVITWPSRDVAGVNTLLRHGLTPLAVIAARTTGGPAPAPPPGSQLPPAPPSRPAPPPPGVQIRRAGLADLDQVVDLGMGLIRYDALFGAVVERPESAAALRHETADLLAEPEPWVWLAERAGATVGMLTGESPQDATWIAPLISRSPVAYLLMMFVTPGERGSGVGAALAARFHHQLELAEVPVALLHYAQTNPLSVPFWSQQRYRPLWTSWEARPAAALR